MGIIAKNTITGFVYLALGALGLYLAIPPGYASPMFPAAGFAIAVTLCFGNNVLPGVWLGSFALNFGLAVMHGQLDFTHTAVSVVLGLGAVSQTYLAKRLVEHWQPEAWRHLEIERDIALFLVLTGPIACLTSASIGVTTLWVAGIVSPVSVFFAWLNWWIGDTLGTMIFAPLVMTFLLRKSPLWGVRLKIIVIPLLMAIITAIAVFRGMTRIEYSQIQSDVRGYGQKIALALDRRFVAHQEAIASLSRLIEVSPDMTFEQFEDFTRLTLQDNKDIFAMSYNPIVQDADRQKFESSMVSRSPVPGFHITERNAQKRLVTAARSPHYVVVGFIAPLQGNLPAIGFNINSEPVRRAAIEKSISSGKTVVTAPIQLVQEKLKRVGVLILDPVYLRKKDVPTEYRPITSFAVGVVKLDEMIEIATENIREKNLTFHIQDTTSEGERKDIYRFNSTSPLSDSLFMWKMHLKMADRQWTLTVIPTADYIMQNRSWLTWTIGVISLLFTVLLLVIMLAITGRNSAIQRKVVEQTAELTQAKEEMEGFNRSLQEKVKESLADLRRKDQVMIIQSRQAAMGEMIGAIAHQWRQPLNSLGLILQNLQDAHDYGELDAAYTERTVKQAMALIQLMSKTIDDFRDFFRPHKERAYFCPLKTVERVLMLFSAQLAANTIEIQLYCVKKDITFSLDDHVTHCSQFIDGFENEFEHVLMNLISNSREAILERRNSGPGVQEKPGWIRIEFDCKDDTIRLAISDNGGGIAQENMEKVFTPYFTTKDPDKGTGMGLYMSKVIIEEHSHGSLRVTNGLEGAVFTIILPLAAKGVTDGRA